MDYLWNKFRHPEFNPSTGLDNEVIEQNLLKLEERLRNLPRPAAKARLFEYVADNLQIDVNPHDFFVGFACWNRKKWPLLPVANLWNRDIYDTKQKYGKQIDEGCKTGRFAIWKDFDHSVPDWDVLFKFGFSGLLQRAKEYRVLHERNGTLTADAIGYFDGIEITYRAILRMLERFRNLALANMGNQPRLEMIADSLETLRDGPPRNFYDALHFIYLYFMFSEHLDRMQVRSLGNLDRILYPFYERDIKEKRFTKSQIRELLDHFFMQWGSINNYWGQPAYLGGTKSNGETEVNELSYIILEELDKLRLPTPKFQLKVAKKTPQEFIDLAFGMIRSWNASLVFVCEDGYKRAIMELGFSEDDARTCDISGCYEFLIKGKHNHTSPAHLNLLKAIELVLNNGVDPLTGIEVGLKTGEAETLATFEDFYAAYKRQLGHTIADIIRYVNDFEPYLHFINPGNVLSATNEDSLKTAKDAFSDGCVCNITCILIIGLGTAIDALMAVQRYVYEEREVTLRRFRDILNGNWEGADKLRLKILNDPAKYGNGNARVDSCMKDLARFLCSQINGRPNARGGYYIASAHTAKQYFELGRKTGATPDGRKAHDEMSKNLSPTMGMDRNGVTSLIRSVTTVDSVQFPGDFPLDVMLHPTSVQGNDGLAAMRGILSTYNNLNGMAIHFNIFSADQLLDAQKHPEKYENLQVRVCGWNVRFNDMDRKEQDAFIERARHLGTTVFRNSRQQAETL